MASASLHCNIVIIRMSKVLASLQEKGIIMSEEKINQIVLPSQQLLGQSQLWQNQKNVWYILKVNDNDTTEQISHIVLVFPLWTLNK